MATAAGTIPRTAEVGGIWSWLTTVDHKRIGALYGVTGFTFFLLGGMEAILLRTQLAVPNGDVIDADRFNQLFTMHALTMIFLAIMPMGAAFFNYFIPLMIGARDVAFPRLNALSYWVFLAGGVLLTSSFVFGGAPDAGWFAYAPLTESKFSPGNGMNRDQTGHLKFCSNGSLVRVAAVRGRDMLRLAPTSALARCACEIESSANGRLGPFVTNAAPSTFRR